MLNIRNFYCKSFYNILKVNSLNNTKYLAATRKKEYHYQILKLVNLLCFIRIC